MFKPPYQQRPESKEKTPSLIKPDDQSTDSTPSVHESPQTVPIESRKTARKSSQFCEWRIRGIPITHDYQVRHKAQQEGFTTTASLIRTLVYRWLFPEGSK